MVREISLPQRFVVGGWSVDFEPATGWLREVRWRGTEVVRAIYTAVRDEHWGTNTPAVEAWNAAVVGTAHEITWKGRSFESGVEWDLRIRLAADGSLTYAADGRVTRDTVTNRTGLCLLHPPRQAGAEVTVFHPDATSTSRHFPQAIDPQAPFAPFVGLLVKDDVVGDLRLTFRGEVFETEDQRNWTDASFKTYCRPLTEATPYRLSAGERIHHLVELSVHHLDAPAAASPEMVDLDAVGRQEVVRPDENGDARPGAIARPALGLGIDPTVPLDASATEQLRLIRPEFLWADVAETGWAKTLEGLRTAANPVGASVELRIALRTWSDQVAASDHAALLKALTGGRLVLEFDGWSDHEASLVKELTDAAWGAETEIVLAARQQFTELNRLRPPLDGVTGVGFAVSPQVHAFDDRSILENAETVETVVRDARALADFRTVHVGPVTLARRDRPEDPRARTWLGAAYLIRVLMAATRAGASSLSLFRLNGPDGLLSGARWMPSLETLAALRRSPLWRMGIDPATQLSLLDAGTSGMWVVNPSTRPVATWTERAFTSTATWRSGQAIECHPGEPVVVPPMDAALVRLRG